MKLRSEWSDRAGQRSSGLGELLGARCAVARGFGCGAMVAFALMRRHARLLIAQCPIGVRASACFCFTRTTSFHSPAFPLAPCYASASASLSYLLLLRFML
eukprot:5815368-Pleurochrysis_carterae.AAC.1